MVLNALVFHAILIPLFATRICATMFWVTLWAYCQQQGYFDFFFSWSDLEFRLLLEYPLWLVQWPTLLVLALLAYVEYRLENSSTWTQTLASQDGLVKGVTNLFFGQWVLVKLSVTSTAVLVVQAGFGWSLLWLLPFSLAIWVLASFRRRAYSLLTEMDEEDDLGLRKLFTLAEDGGIAITSLCLIVLPILALLLGLAAMVLLVLMRIYVAHREQSIKVDCRACHQPNHPAAPICGYCKRPHEHVVGISLFNQPTEKPMIDMVQHRLRLMIRRRCPQCATQLTQATIQQPCPRCKAITFSSLQQAKQLDEYLYWSLPKTLLIVSLLGLIPLIGLIPGMIYYRLHIIAGYRAYLPPTRGCLTRSLARCMTVVLIAFQGIPILGAISLPTLCFLHTTLYRTAFRREAAHTFDQEEPLPKGRTPLP